MKFLLRTVLVFLCIGTSVTLSSARASQAYRDVEKDRLYVPASERLSVFNAQALSSAALSLYIAHAAQKYGELLNDPSLTRLPLEDRHIRIYVTHPTIPSDTLYQIDLRIYSPSYVGRRYNRMLIIRPYDDIKRPCILYTHGNNGNLNTWYNYYLAGVADMLQRGYAVAFYENYNNSFFSNNSNSDILYKDWVHKNLADSTQNIAPDHAIQRGHYLLYQYAYAAHTYLTHIAAEYNIDERMLFTAGHSAGGLSSMQLAFARPERNFRHPLFEYCGKYDSRKYPDIPDQRIPIKGVLCSAAGLQDDNVQGSYFGSYFDEEHRDKVVAMIHGANDPLISVDYGSGLWGGFVDTVKMLGPLKLHPLMNSFGIKNFTFINCIGQHGVFMYPATSSDNSGYFKNLAPFSYDYMNLTDEMFFSDTALYQIHLHNQQLHHMMSYIAQIFSGIYQEETIEIPSAIYTWQPKEYTTIIDTKRLNWIPEPTDCGIEGAKIEDFILSESVPVRNPERDLPEILLYPNPVAGILHIRSMNTLQHIQISDITGKIRFSAESLNSITQVDTSRLENGIYFVSVRDPRSREFVRKKFIVQR